MKRFIVVGVMAICVVLASAGYVQAFGGHGGGHGGHFGGHEGGHGGHFGEHFGGHGFHGEHFGGHFGDHSFHEGHFDHFGHFPPGGIFQHPDGFPQGFGHRGFFPHHGGGGGFFSPFAFRAGPPVAIIKDPFFCFPHGLGFTDQNAFFAHLQDLHGISPGHAPAHLIQTGERFIFLDF